MASSELLPLGRALDRVLPKVRRDILERLLPSLLAQPEAARSLLIQIMAGAYATGVQTGWVVHGSLLGGIPTAITGAAAREWRDRAMQHGEFIANRFGRLLELEPTVAQLTRHAAVAGESSVWNGQDDAAQEVATLAEAEWKVWVRAWPRKEHRNWHDTLEGVTIPEEDLFTLPGGPNEGAQVYGPRDWERVPDAGEHLNCGHALRYQRHATAEDLEGARRGAGIVYKPPGLSKNWSEGGVQQVLHGQVVRSPLSIDPEIAATVGSPARVAYLSLETMEKQYRHHPELPDTVYLDLPRLLASPPTLLHTEKDALIAISDPPNSVLVVLKVSRNREELVIVSVRYTHGADIEREMKTARILRRSKK